MTFPYVHRVVWEALHGSLASDEHIDLCTIRDCVNPTHLEPVSAAENNRRAQLRRSGPVTSWLAVDEERFYRVPGGV